MDVITINSKTAKLAELVDTQTVKVKFNAGINDVSTGAFTALDSDSNSIIDSVEFDGTSIVTLKLKKDKVKTDGTGLVLNIDPSKLTSVAGKITAGSGVTINTANLLDSVAPEITNTTAYDIAGEVIKITYSEALEFGTSNQELKNSDFTVVRISDNKTLDVDGGYTVAIAGGSKEIHITLKDTATRTSETAYRVTVKGAKYTTDSAANEITDSVGVSDKITFTAASALTVLNTALDAAGTATEANYSAAGITGVTTGNLTAINTAVETGKSSGVALSKTAIQDLVDAELLALKALTSFTAITFTQTGTITGTNVQYQTAAAVIAALPTNVTVTLADSTTAVVPVTWADTDTYDAATAGDYTFTAIWGTLPAGVNNSASLAVPTVEVTVAP
ncbi:Ig-like domain-containing protein [Sporosarcina sp. FA9]|uniref:Ig-like domain-containing protein n=1 Tax=Sporosarcina sp. FA9 TaxID=3413030 RepID=UPI003F65C480